MDKSSKIYVAGHRGLVGAAIVRRLEAEGFSNLLLRTHAELNLTDQMAVRTFFETEKPNYVFLSAARVGGILANKTYPAEFLYQNLMIETNIIHNAYLSGVKKLMFLGSSCIYPRLCPQPMKEEHLLTGPLEPTNEAYALAKIAGLRMCEYYHNQYNVNFISIMPPNVYGPGDHFEPLNSHVISALLLKAHQAKQNGQDHIEIWGTGNARREMLFVDDLADACLFLMDNYNQPEFINAGCGIDYTIREFAEMIRETVGFSGELRFDKSKPDGMPKKLLDSSRIQSLGWKAKTGMREGLQKTYQWYLNNRAERIKNER
jgi:GDP-L-fucose synthase